MTDEEIAARLLQAREEKPSKRFWLLKTPREYVVVVPFSVGLCLLAYTADKILLLALAAVMLGGVLRDLALFCQRDELVEFACRVLSEEELRSIADSGTGQQLERQVPSETADSDGSSS